MTDTTTTTEVKDIDYQTDRYLVRKYVSRILTRFPRYRDDARWDDFPNDQVLTSDLLGLPREDRHRWRRLDREDVAPLRRLLTRVARENSSRDCPNGLISRNLHTLARELHLTGAERELLTFLLALNQYPEVDRLVLFPDYAPSERFLLVSTATGLAPDELQSLLSDGSTLVSTGLVEQDRFDPFTNKTFPSLDARLLKALIRLHEGPDHVLSWAFSNEPGPDWPLEAFDHIRPWPEVARRCLSAADSSGRGLNVLLHGPVGAGKTALARCLAKSAGLDLFRPQDEGPLTRWSQTALSGPFALLRRRGRGILLLNPTFFTMDLTHGIGPMSVLGLMDHPGVQVFWMVYSLDEVHPAVRSRFDLILAVPEPAEPWTRPVWEDLLTPDERANLGIG